MNSKFVKNILIPAGLLILPVVLVLFFDPAAWNSTADLLWDILGTIFFVDIPVGICLWHWFKPEHFKGMRFLLILGGLSFVSWTTVAGTMWLACFFGHMPENGFSAVCAYLFGWAYIWVFMLPIGACYMIFHVILRLIKKKRLFFLAISVSAIMIPLALALRGCGLFPAFQDRDIRAADYSQALSMLEDTNNLPKRMIPPGATDIEFFHRSGVAPMAYLKCKCSEEALRAFGIAQDYDFQGENIFKNSALDYTTDINALSVVSCRAAVPGIHWFSFGYRGMSVPKNKFQERSAL